MRKYHRKKAANKSLYKYHPWCIEENEFSIRHNHHNEAIFALGNGYMGIRGILEEDYAGPVCTTTPGIYINGVYESEEIIYGESYPRSPKNSQTIVNLANWLKINLYLDGEKLNLLSGKITDYHRIINMKDGFLIRKFIWESPGGKRVSVSIKRFLSFTMRHSALINYEVTPLNFSGQIKILSEIDGDVQNYHFLRRKKVLDTIGTGFAGGYGYICQETQNTRIMVGIIMDNCLSYSEGNSHQEDRYYDGKSVCHEFIIDARKGLTYRLNKNVVLYSSMEVEKEKLLDKLISTVECICETGWQKMLKRHIDYLEGYWHDADVKIIGDDALQQGFNFNAFHLLQSAGREGKTNIPAKGLTGEFYEGHYFWDSETYVMPFFLYTRPEIARDLLMFRYNKLDNARRNARRMKLDGALYPWRTLNGDEASGFFMGSTIQYHINADIAYAVWLYFEVTKDCEFLYQYGAEILAETARMWLSRGNYIDSKDNKFCLNVVCGPDEYQPGVNNNCYTNYMAKFNLKFAVKVLRDMKEELPERYYQLVKKINFEENELSEWEKAYKNMYLPYSKELKVHPQDDSFLYKEALDVDAIPEEEIPLVRNWHPLTIWRYQVIKQADVILLMLLQGDEFSLEEKKNNYDYYEPKTTHDSSLSPAIYSIISSEIGYKDAAYNYFMQTARLDLDDYNNNAYQGVHTACMAGSWLALVQGFAGMRVKEDYLYFDPYVPDKWEGYNFKIKYRGRRLRVEVSPEKCRYTLLEGETLTISHRGEKKLIKKEKAAALNIG